jgi:hypothetical protein
MIRRRPPPPEVCPSVIRRGYEFAFEIDGLRIQAGGSAFTGQEWVYLNGERISQRRNRSAICQHDFVRDGRQYRIEFEMIKGFQGALACRLYRDGTLCKLAVATPQHLPWSGPLFGLALIVGLYLTDTGTVDVPWSYYLLTFLAAVILDIGYASRHIRVMELEV